MLLVEVKEAENSAHFTDLFNTPHQHYLKLIGKTVLDSHWKNTKQSGE